MNPACEQSQIRPTLGAQGRGQRRATLRRNGKRAPPVVAHRHTIQPSHAEPSSHFAEAQIHARLTNPAKPNIITSIRGSRRPVADFKSEPRPASNRNQWPASYWNAWPASSVSARQSQIVACSTNGAPHNLNYPMIQSLPPGSQQNVSNGGTDSVGARSAWLVRAGVGG